MIFIQKKYNTIFLAVLCLVLLVSIFYWIHFLTTNKYIVECFTPGVFEEIGGAVSDTVDLPLTTKYSCRNFCGPNARCSITGQQCSADIDCPGCQPYSPPLSSSGQTIIPGDNAAGKLTFGQTPQYSSLTSGFGTQERVITNNMFSKPSMPNFGGNIWISQFKSDQELFDSRYKPHQLKNMPNYPERYSLSGQFVENGPFASNSPYL
jgi:hypothetical protein